MSLNGTCSNPGTSGSNGSRKSFRQVALSAPIVRPWKPRIAAMIFFLRVEARANLIAASTASEPELLRKTRPRFFGATERSFSTKVAFAVVPNAGPTWMSSRAWASIASTMAGLQCPRLPTPKDAPQSGDGRQEDEGLRFHRDRDLGGHTVRIRVNQLTLRRDAGRGDHGNVSRVEEELD